MSMTVRRAIASLVISGLLLTACAKTNNDTKPTDTDSGQVTLVTHDSFNLSAEALAAMEQAAGVKVTVLPSGDAGAMVNKLVLTKSNPIGDAVFGVDNTFASRALDEGVIADAGVSALPDSPAQGVDPKLVPIDFGDVCINIDKAYFADKGIPAPKTLDDLTKAEYKNLLVTPSPATSSPGLAFLLATVAAYPDDGYLGFWRKLKDNGAKVTAGWTDAYNVDFSASEGKGDRPIVLSYASSPAFEVNEDKSDSATVALLDTCFRQVEYAGVLAGAKNPQGAKKVVEYLLSDTFQQGIPGLMYMYPVSKKITLDPAWTTFAPVATDPKTVDPQKIAANREKWVNAWSEVMEG